ncbi:MAG: AAA family ATPase [Bacteroidetes bacterium]|nr:AAA family ATPase [Bacteroidota bacterium]
MENYEFELAEQFALQTNQHIFLTGKAGSGKTTLLKHIANKALKKFVIVAPTGVAAINAGGVTIHSMFNLPLTSFIPSDDVVDLNIITNRRGLLSHMRYSREKRAVLQELELLIIDEVSMVRSDILDAIDFLMRTVRRNNEPFGGVQVMLIGDMHQLPPVTRDHEWALLRNYYQSPYFFDSLVWKLMDAVQIELTKIYRQQDRTFLQILNNIRNKDLQEDDFHELEKRYKPDYKPTDEGYVILSTHNRKVDSVNEEELKKLPGFLYSFDAHIEGDFPESMFPCESIMYLREGAQVMFIKNDVLAGQYYNGKLATITKIEDDEITVTFIDNKQKFIVPRVVWENINYSTDQNENIVKKVQGSFSQFPLRLAWAITIHKSQGLTFDKVIIDAGQSFAAGQVYVALSRCRTLDGIVLHSRITQNSLFTDEKINTFSDSHHRTNELQNILEDAKLRYAKAQLKMLFNFTKLHSRSSDWKELIEAKDIPQKENVLILCTVTINNLNQIIDTGNKFQNQLEKLLDGFHGNEEQQTIITERCNKAITYFTTEIYNKVISLMHTHIEGFAFKAKIKKYVQQTQEIENSFWNCISRLYRATFLNKQIFTGEILHIKSAEKKTITANTSEKKEKGATYVDTLNLFNEGKSLQEIAEIRSIVLSTVQSHIAKWILEGAIDIHKIFPQEKVERVMKFIQDNPNDTIGNLKSHFGDAYDFPELRMLMNHHIWNKKNNN